MLDALRARTCRATSPRPTGAFYYFLQRAHALDPMTLTERLIREHRVAVIPGSAFGDDRRLLSCACRTARSIDETVAEGIGRLVADSALAA